MLIIGRKRKEKAMQPVIEKLFVHAVCENPPAEILFVHSKDLLSFQGRFVNEDTTPRIGTPNIIVVFVLGPFDIPALNVPVLVHRVVTGDIWYQEAHSTTLIALPGLCSRHIESSVLGWSSFFKEYTLGLVAPSHDDVSARDIEGLLRHPTRTFILFPGLTKLGIDVWRWYAVFNEPVVARNRIKHGQRRVLKKGAFVQEATTYLKMNTKEPAAMALFRSFFNNLKDAPSESAAVAAQPTQPQDSQFTDWVAWCTKIVSVMLDELANGSFDPVHGAGVDMIRRLTGSVLPEAEAESLTIALVTDTYAIINETTRIDDPNDLRVRIARDYVNKFPSEMARAALDDVPRPLVTEIINKLAQSLVLLKSAGVF